MFKMMHFYSLIAMLVITAAASAVNLFEIKDEVGNPVLVVSSDGLRILNGADTLMVISTEGIKAFIQQDAAKGLSRTFSVTTSSSKGSAADVMNVTSDGMRIYDQTTDTGKALGDTLMTISSKAIKAYIASGGKGLSRSFSVTTSSSKGSGDYSLDISTDSTKIGTGATTMGHYSERYTDFSPENICIGMNSGTAITSGTGNTFMGNSAGMSNQGGNNNVMIGLNAGKLYDGSFGNVFIGDSAADSLRAGHSNVMVGYKAGAVPEETQISYGNVFVGAFAGKRVSGDYNVIIGESAGDNYKLGSPGSYNIYMGRYAGRFNTGNSNICIGENAGNGEYNNPLTGDNNIFIGYGADATNIDDDYRFVVGCSYGDLLYGKLDNSKQLVVNGNLTHNANGRTFFVNGDAGGLYAWYNDSDERLKKNIETIENGLDKVMKLRGVTYEWKDAEALEKGKRMGFIAQESKDIIPEVVDYNSENDRYSMQYASITAVLVEAIKDLKRQADANIASVQTKESENKQIIEGQNDKIGMLIKENKELKDKVQQLESLRAEIEIIKSRLGGYSSR